MIYTITLNPALDISGTVEELIPNEKSYVSNEIHTPGGNGINAAIIASRLSAKVVATGFLGGSNGQEIKKLLDNYKVNHSFVSISENTRMNLTVSNCKTLKQTRLSFPGPNIKKSELGRLNDFSEKMTSSDVAVIGGSLPPGIETSYIEKLIRRLKKKNILCMVDVPGTILRHITDSGPDFIKPNLVEFQDLVGKKVTTIKSILPLARKLNKKIPLICISSVEGGALLVSSEEAWFGKIPKVKIRSTVGAGDSMVGAIAAKLSNKKKPTMEELLREGLAAACATLAQEGMTLGAKKDIVRYRSQILLKQIRGH